MMIRTTIMFSLFLAVPAFAQTATQTASQTSDFAELPVDSRMKVLVYDESDVYTIRTKYGYQTNIVFDANEEIETISVGDRSVWQIIPHRYRLFIRPMQENVTTNMTVLTNKRSYQFDLKSLSDDSKETGNIYVARFVYPAPGLRTTPSLNAIYDSPPQMTTPENMSMIPAENASSNKSSPETWNHSKQPVLPNYRYSFSGPDELQPHQVYDDGRSTFVVLRQINDPLPDVFMVDSNGAQLPLPYRMKGNAMVIDKVVGELVLNTLGGSVHVYNDVLNPNAG